MLHLYIVAVKEQVSVKIMKLFVILVRIVIMIGMSKAL